MSARLGFGVSGPLGQFWFDERKTRNLILTALEKGVLHFDTAPFYFNAEARLGAALRTAGHADVFISTKTGTRRRGRGLIKDFSEAGMRADVEASRRRLDRPALDLLYLHGPSVAQIKESSPILAALKREGAVRKIGVCGEGETLRFAAENGFDAVMGVYNLLDRRHADIFALARAKGLMTVAIAPLAQGALGGRRRAPASLADLWSLARRTLRSRYSHAEIAGLRDALGNDPAGAALGFALANADVDIVMTTTTKISHLVRSIAVAQGPSLDRPRGGA